MDVTPAPLQIERLRRTMSRFARVKAVGFGSLALFPILLIMPYTTGVAIPVFLVVSVSATLYGASLLRSGLSCPMCSAVTRLDRYWVCGFCTFEHTTRHLLFNHTFVEKCARCPNTPHSLICFRCRKPSIFDQDVFSRSPTKSAWLPDSPPLSEAPPEKPMQPPRPIDDDLRR